MKNKPKSLNNNVLLEFSANLQKAVNDTGLTPYLLAKNLGLDKQAISRLLKGDRDPNLSTVVRIVKSMQISMDQLLGLTPVKPKAEVEIKKENLNLIDRISALHEQDVELLEAIVEVLEKRRARTMAKFLNAVRDAKSPKSKENPMGKTVKKVRKQQAGKVSSGSDNGDDEFGDDEFEDDFDDFEEDSDTSENDDFDEDDGRDNYDEDEDYEEDDDYEEDEDEEEDDLGDGNDDDFDYDEFD